MWGTGADPAWPGAGSFTFGLRHQRCVRLRDCTEQAGWGFFFWLVGFFLLIPRFEFLKPFCATIYKRNTGLRPRLGYALGFRIFEDYDLLQDLVNSKNSFLVLLQKV